MSNECLLVELNVFTTQVKAGGHSLINPSSRYKSTCEIWKHCYNIKPMNSFRVSLKISSWNILLRY